MINLLIIAGGRDFKNSTIMADVVTKLVDQSIVAKDCKLICGMAKGADLIAYNLYGATNNNKFFPKWNDLKAKPRNILVSRFGYSYNALAGFNRNQAMAEHAEGLVAFWDGKSKGTKHMISCMDKLDKPIFVFDYLGEILS